MRYSEFNQNLTEKDFTIVQGDSGQWNVLNKNGQVVATKKFRGAAQQTANELERKISNQPDDKDQSNDKDKSKSRTSEKEARTEAKKVATKTLSTFKGTAVGGVVALIVEINDMQDSLERVAVGYYLDGCKWGSNSRLAARVVGRDLAELLLNAVIGAGLAGAATKILAMSRLIALAPGWGWIVSLALAGFTGAAYALITEAFKRYDKLPSYLADKVLKPEMFKILKMYAKQSNLCKSNESNGDGDGEDFVVENSRESEDKIKEIGSEFAKIALDSKKIPNKVKKEIRQKIK